MSIAHIFVQWSQVMKMAGWWKSNLDHSILRGCQNGLSLQTRGAVITLTTTSC